LEISVERGVVLVQGTVATYYLRQIAIEYIKRVEGAIQVIDQIEVVDGPVHASIPSHNPRYSEGKLP
jgi:osmotically-inducible protein OsmY